MIKILDRGFYYKALCPSCFSTFVFDKGDLQDHMRYTHESIMPIPTGDKYIVCPICQKTIEAESPYITIVQKRGAHCQLTFEEECEEKGIDWNDLV